LRATALRQDWKIWAFGGAWIVAITASAPFWTLFTRSTVGGVVLNIGVQSFIGFTVPWANLAAWLRARGYLSPGNPFVVSAVTFVFLCYAGVMLWLGWRLLARFQATGGMAGDDLLTAGPDVMPGAWAGWLRCRSKGAALNLIRKKLRLLRPVWLISLLAALGWACLSLFGSLFERGSSKNFEIAVVIVGVVSTLMIAIFAGSLSLGDARLATDLAGVGPPPVAYQAVHSAVRGFGWRGAAPVVDRRENSIWSVSDIFGCSFRNGLARRGANSDLCLILVRVRRQGDSACGAVGFSGADRRRPGQSVR
jgi:hypothetical protein